MALVRAESSKHFEVAIKFLSSLPLLTPEEMFNLLSKKGYKGQEKARKSACLLAYRHIKRLKLMYLNNVASEKLPPRTNYLFMGPTGCGKTFLVELLFREIFSLPTVIVDITSFSETGYVGDDVRTILTRLLYAARMNPVLASFGVICLDEFDKLATTQNTARFDGAGSTKDVSGLGVQKELLKLVEGSIVPVPLDFNNTVYSQRIDLNTENIVFIGCGAFSGIKGLYKSTQGSSSLGFTQKVEKSDSQRIAADYTDDMAENIELLYLYGFLPELVARFQRIVPMKALDARTLKSILVDNVISKFKNEFLTEGIELEVEEEVLDYIVEQSFKRQTGARGLESILTKHIEDVAFEYFGRNKKAKLTLKFKNGEITPHFVPLR